MFQSTRVRLDSPRSRSERRSFGIRRPPNTKFHWPAPTNRHPFRFSGSVTQQPCRREPHPRHGEIGAPQLSCNVQRKFTRAARPVPRSCPTDTPCVLVLETFESRWNASGAPGLVSSKCLGLKRRSHFGDWDFTHSGVNVIGVS